MMQRQADRDADRGQDPGRRDRQDIGEGGPDGLGKVEVDPAVADILHRLDQRRLEQEHGGELEDLADEEADDAGERRAVRPRWP